jgi:hypothetical protein
MSITKKYEKLIKKYISDDISETEKEILLNEAGVNAEINDLIKLHQGLTQEQLSFEIADEKSFKELRLKILNDINNSSKSKTDLSMQIRGYFSALFRKPLFNAAIAIAMFFAGYFINSSKSESEFVENIYSTATRTQDLQSSINEPYIYQNAKFRPLDNGRVQVSFDVTRHLEISKSKNDPLIQDILAQSLINSSSVPERLRSISNTSFTMHPKIKQALITTMLNDSHPIVRQKSLFSLMKYKNDKDIQDALIQLLDKEESVYMRLAAVDYLSNNDVDMSILEQNINTLDYKNSAINQKIKQLKYKP